MRRGGAPVAATFGVALVASACAALVGLDDPGELGAGPPDSSTRGVTDATTANDVATSDVVVPSDAGDGGAAACSEPDLLAYWRMDEGAGTTVHDCAKYGHDGMLSGDAGWVPGRNGGSALAFVLDDFVDFGNPTTMRVTGALTVSAWVRVRSFANAGRVVTKNGPVGDRGWDLNFEADGRLQFRIAADADTQVVAEVGSFPVGEWTHVAGVYEPSSAVRLYVGASTTSVTQGTQVPAVMRDSTQELRIGRRQDCCSFDGDVDEVRIYGRALTANEVKALAQ